MLVSESWFELESFRPLYTLHEGNIIERGGGGTSGRFRAMNFEVTFFDTKMLLGL